MVEGLFSFFVSSYSNAEKTEDRSRLIATD